MNQQSNQITARHGAQTRRLASADALIQAIRARERPDGRALLIALTGFGGAGKSTLAAVLADALADAAVVSLDDFWAPTRDRPGADWDAFDRDRLAREVLVPARAGQTIRYRPPVWPSGEPGPWRTIAPGAYLIVEGVSALHPSLRSYYDLSIWLDCPLPVATARGIARDRDAGLDNEATWRNLWEPNERAYFARHRPDQAATFLCAPEPENSDAVA